MPNKFLYTKRKYRLLFAKTIKPGKFNLVFLPSGPGFGSEYLWSLINILNIPGNLWLIDYPGDGDNKIKFTTPEPDYLTIWQEGLIELIQCLPNVILVGHSFGGMLILSTQGLQKYLSGLILLNTAPDNKWFKPHDLTNYAIDDASFRKSSLEKGVKYFFNPDKIIQGRALLDKLPFNAKTFNWSREVFHKNYKYTWLPDIDKTIIIGSSNDKITPVTYFLQEPNFKDYNIIDIENASHCCWFDAPEKINQIFEFATL